MYSIGEFSRMTGLTIKALRFYHDQGLLIPAQIDANSRYRYYAEEQLENATVIARLRDLGLSVKEIGKILSEGDGEENFLDLLQQHLDRIADQIQELRDARKKLQLVIQSEKMARQDISVPKLKIEKKQLDPILVAGIRELGSYQNCGKRFGKIGRKFGRHINGPAMMLCYDQEFKEENADYEACLPIRQGQAKSGIEVRELPGGSCLALVHRGPYQTINRSYRRIFQHAYDSKLEVLSPTREVYIKGPGMIFKGNPEKYLTEIQILFPS